MKNKPSRDQLGRYECRDMYYVQSTPKVVKVARDESRTDTDKLERELYAKLQGHQGVILPLIGSVFRIIFLTIMFPFHLIGMCYRKLCRWSSLVYQKIEGIVAPRYRRVSAICKRISDAVYNLIARCIAKIGPVRQAIKSRLAVLSWDHISRYGNKGVSVGRSIGNYVMNKWIRLNAWIRVLSRYAARVLEDWALEMKHWFSTQ